MLKLWNLIRPRKFWWGWVGVKNSSVCPNAYQWKRPQLLDSPFHNHFWLVWGNHMWAGCWVSVSWRVHHTGKCRDCWTWQRRWNEGLFVPYCQTHIPGARMPDFGTGSARYQLCDVAQMTNSLCLSFLTDSAYLIGYYEK